MHDVAIIGVGLHPFGRFPKTAIEMGAEAIQLALSDAGVRWQDIQFGFGGSYEVSNPDAVTRLVGLTGIPFTNVFNACATAASSIEQTAEAIRSGRYDIGIAVGMDKHPRGAFTDDPAKLGLPAWYAENGQFVTTKFFGIKANRYIHQHHISQRTLAKVAAKNFRNGALNPNAFRRKPISEDDILASTVLNYPLTQYMFCAPDEGAAAVIMCRGELAARYTTKPVYLRSTAIRTRRYGAYEVHSTWAAVDEDASPTVYASRAAYEAAGIGPEDVGVAQLQDTDAGSEVIHMAENGFCADGEQEKLLAEGATEIGGRIPVNTDGGLIANGEPIGASGIRQVYELVRQLRGQAGDRQVPGKPTVGYAQVYGAPGTAAASVLSI
ncbi:thiolase family protein [Nocardia mexicana]|uniref:Acetyl-CoA acetyltransferase n=1 Tax=Nocardia mexicana TaxID=279262 RepID=A0A370GMY6_9NOCA|nr:thiolase family protein [Nocardia mexicana]RDI45027.1 acetyl-CoA acetyltransferase [Nocardia mexicana]